LSENGITVISPKLFRTSRNKYETIGLAYSIEDAGLNKTGFFQLD
jgi:hypothetical protein